MTSKWREGQILLCNLLGLYITQLYSDGKHSFLFNQRYFLKHVSTLLSLRIPKFYSYVRILDIKEMIPTHLISVYEVPAFLYSYNSYSFEKKNPWYFLWNQFHNILLGKQGYIKYTLNNYTKLPELHYREHKVILFWTHTYLLPRSFCYGESNTWVHWTNQGSKNCKRIPWKLKQIATSKSSNMTLNVVKISLLKQLFKGKTIWLRVINLFEVHLWSLWTFTFEEKLSCIFSP